MRLRCNLFTKHEQRATRQSRHGEERHTHRSSKQHKATTRCRQSASVSTDPGFPRRAGSRSRRLRSFRAVDRGNTTQQRICCELTAHATSTSASSACQCVTDVELVRQTLLHGTVTLDINKLNKGERKHEHARTGKRISDRQWGRRRESNGSNRRWTIEATASVEQRIGAARRQRRRRRGRRQCSSSAHRSPSRLGRPSTAPRNCMRSLCLRCARWPRNPIQLIEKRMQPIVCRRRDCRCARASSVAPPCLHPCRRSRCLKRGVLHRQ